MLQESLYQPHDELKRRARVHGGAGSWIRSPWPTVKGLEKREFEPEWSAFRNALTDKADPTSSRNGSEKIPSRVTGEANKK